MTDLNPPSKLAQAALIEFAKVSQRNWTGIVRLRELLGRANQVAVAMNDGDAGGTSPAGRVKPTFTERSFRHYQTLGCIDEPEKRGRLASYGFRHFVQALLVRRLLAERVPSEQIVTLAGRDTGELERMLRGGVEITARPGGESDGAESSDSAAELMEAWNRVRLAPGLELHVSSKLPQLGREDYKRISALLKRILMRQRS